MEILERLDEAHWRGRPRWSIGLSPVAVARLQMDTDSAIAWRTLSQNYDAATARMAYDSLRAEHPHRAPAGQTATVASAVGLPTSWQEAETRVLGTTPTFTVNAKPVVLGFGAGIVLGFILAKIF